MIGIKKRWHAVKKEIKQRKLPRGFVNPKVKESYETKWGRISKS